MGSFLGWILNSQVTKTAGITAAGGSVSLIILFSALDERIDARLTEVKSQTENYVDAKHETVILKLSHLKNSQDEIKVLLRSIDDKVYQLNKGK